MLQLMSYRTWFACWLLKIQSNEINRPKKRDQFSSPRSFRIEARRPCRRAANLMRLSLPTSRLLILRPSQRACVRSQRACVGRALPSQLICAQKGLDFASDRATLRAAISSDAQPREPPGKTQSLDRLIGEGKDQGGIVKPSASAVFRLTTSSSFVVYSTGKSAGLAPFRTLAT